LALCLLLTVNISGQGSNNDFVLKGLKLYENGQYNEAIKYCKSLIEQNAFNLEETYCLLGNLYCKAGKTENAVKTLKTGLARYPNSCSLNYNLASVLYNLKDYENAEKAAIKAIEIKRQDVGSHMILSSIMQAKGQRARSVLPLYYALMLEPKTVQAESNYKKLICQLKQGVEKESDKKINVYINPSSSTDKDFGAADMLIGLLVATKYMSENQYKSYMDMFVEINKGFFSILGDLKNDNKGFWWDIYVTKFYDLVQSDNYEAYSYYIAQSQNSEDVNKWIDEHPAEIQNLISWISK
jgi:tetratricopeptide (TPR) repeat protein